MWPKPKTLTTFLSNGGDAVSMKKLQEFKCKKCGKTFEDLVRDLSSR